MSFILIAEFVGGRRYQMGILGCTMAHHVSPRKAKLIGNVVRLYPTNWLMCFTQLRMHGADCF